MCFFIAIFLRVSSLCSSCKDLQHKVNLACGVGLTLSFFSFFLIDIMSDRYVLHGPHTSYFKISSLQLLFNVSQRTQCFQCCTCI